MWPQWLNGNAYAWTYDIWLYITHVYESLLSTLLGHWYQQHVAIHHEANITEHSSGTWYQYHETIYHVLKSMYCHKAIVISCIYI